MLVVKFLHSNRTLLQTQGPHVRHVHHLAELLQIDPFGLFHWRLILLLWWRGWRRLWLRLRCRRRLLTRTGRCRRSYGADRCLHDGTGYSDGRYRRCDGGVRFRRRIHSRPMQSTSNGNRPRGRRWCGGGGVGLLCTSSQRWNATRRTRFVRRSAHRCRLVYSLHRSSRGSCLSLLIFLLLAKTGLSGIRFRSRRTLGRRWTTPGVQVFTLLLLQIFTIPGCRFRCFDKVIRIVLLLLLLWWWWLLLLLGGNMRTWVLMVVHGSSASILQLRLLGDNWMRLLLRYCQRRTVWLLLLMLLLL